MFAVQELFQLGRVASGRFRHQKSFFHFFHFFVRHVRRGTIASFALQRDRVPLHVQTDRRPPRATSNASLFRHTQVFSVHGKTQGILAEIKTHRHHIALGVILSVRFRTGTALAMVIQGFRTGVKTIGVVVVFDFFVRRTFVANVRVHHLMFHTVLHLIVPFHDANENVVFRVQCIDLNVPGHHLFMVLPLVDGPIDNGGRKFRRGGLFQRVFVAV